MIARKPRKIQDRTAITRECLLRAAEKVFARRGYESALLAEIAEAAGFSKGALYAHFKSKEDLFLALALEKAATLHASLSNALSQAPTREAKILAFRSFYIGLAVDREWALLILEAKLFMTRHRKVRERLLEAESNLEVSVEQALLKVFGKAKRTPAKALGGIVAALVLESHLEPEAFTARKIRAMLGTIFDSLLGVDDSVEV
ncbi:TetR/AcrR family transcriptional regulator [Acidipila sp. EB88]|nr:TetR/AcrR family transcriptional regulator [Acidipila sp. EB88]